MVAKVKDASLKHIINSVEGCRHHWLIEIADGPISKGVCKCCGAEREFYNSFQEVTSEKHGNHKFKMADIIGDEPESNLEEEEPTEDGEALSG